MYCICGFKLQPFVGDSITVDSSDSLRYILGTFLCIHIGHLHYLCRVEHVLQTWLAFQFFCCRDSIYLNLKIQGTLIASCFLEFISKEAFSSWNYVLAKKHLSYVTSRTLCWKITYSFPLTKTKTKHHRCHLSFHILELKLKSTF